MLRRLTIIFACLLIFIMLTTPAYAAGKLNITQENFYVLSQYDRIYAYVYARVENTGDKRAQYNAGLLEVYDENGDALDSSDSLTAYAKYLEPGEYTYVTARMEVDNAQSADDIGDYLLTITGKGNNEDSTIRLSTTSEYQPNVSHGYRSYDHLYAEITNEYDSAIYDIGAVFVLLDKDENILFVASDSWGSNTALTPGSSLACYVTLDTDFAEYFTQQGIVPSHVDVIAYTYPD